MSRYSFFILGLVSAALLLVSVTVPAATLTVKTDGTGNHKTVQAALDAAAEGDTILVSGGSYNEDINIGHLNMPPQKKNNITLKAADGEKVEVALTNTSNRTASLAAAGADFGPVDHLGFLINSDGAVVEGIRFVQNIREVNALNINVAIMIVSSNVTIRKCEFVGPGVDASGDVVGMVVTPLDVVSLSQKIPALATNLSVENCTITSFPYAFANHNFPLELGMDVPSPEATVRNCELTGNGNGIEIDDGTTHVIDCRIHDNLGSGLHISDDTTIVSGCVIENNAQNGFDIDNQELEPDEAQGIPAVTVENCIVAGNGKTPDQRGIRLKCGSLKMTGTVVRGSGGPNLYFDTQVNREISAVIDHCDFYQSAAGIGIATTNDPKTYMNIQITNSIVTDQNGIINDAATVADFSVDYCDIFASGTQFGGDFLSRTNDLNVDPQYVDPANGNFYLKATSTLAKAGKNGTYLGSKGIAVGVTDWMIR